MSEHRPGCDALGGYGHGVGPCTCGAPGSTNAERAAWLADKIVPMGDYAKEAAAMLRRWPSPAGAPAGAPSLHTVVFPEALVGKEAAGAYFRADEVRALLGSVHQAAPQTSTPSAVHSGDAPASAPLAGGSELGAVRQAVEALTPLSNAHFPIERECLTDEDVGNARRAIEALWAAFPAANEYTPRDRGNRI